MSQARKRPCKIAAFLSLMLATVNKQVTSCHNNQQFLETSRAIRFLPNRIEAHTDLTATSSL